MKTYEIVNNHDANDRFEVEADSTEEAAFAALNLLGWYVVDPTEDEE